MEPSNETKICPFCAETINIDALKCRFCNEILDQNMRSLRSKLGTKHLIPKQKVRKWSRGVAGFLSFLIPGVGQIYKRDVASGLLWLIFVPLTFAVTWIAGLLVYIACIYDAAVSDAD